MKQADLRGRWRRLIWEADDAGWPERQMTQADLRGRWRRLTWEADDAGWRVSLLTGRVHANHPLVVVGEGGQVDPIQHEDHDQIFRDFSERVCSKFSKSGIDKHLVCANFFIPSCSRKMLRNTYLKIRNTYLKIRNNYWKIRINYFNN